MEFSVTFYLMKLPGEDFLGRVIQITEQELTVKLNTGVEMAMSRSLGEWPGLHVGQRVLCRVEVAGIEFRQFNRRVQRLRVEGRLVEKTEAGEAD